MTITSNSSPRTPRTRITWHCFHCHHVLATARSEKDTVTMTERCPRCHRFSRRAYYVLPEGERVDNYLKLVLQGAVDWAIGQYRTKYGSLGFTPCKPKLDGPRPATMQAVNPFTGEIETLEEVEPGIFAPQQAVSKPHDQLRLRP